MIVFVKSKSKWKIFTGANELVKNRISKFMKTNHKSNFSSFFSAQLQVKIVY